MGKQLRRLALIGSLVSIVWVFPRAQMLVVPVDEQQGHVALGLALRHLTNTGIFMQATAHPDDENNGLLVMLNRGQGFRTALATATRGNGGQNEIGPELFEALGVLRTEELTALHRFDGAEQYFTRAVDFGYSFSSEETLAKWGPDQTVSDFVRLIRMVRPDVITVQPPDQFNDGAQHPSAGKVSSDAAKLAGDPTKYSEQLADGLRAWQPKSFTSPVGPVRQSRSRSTWLFTIRCSAERIPKWAPKRGACTSARAWRSCSRFPVRRRPRTNSSSPPLPVRLSATSSHSSTTSTRPSLESPNSPGPGRPAS